MENISITYLQEEKAKQALDYYTSLAKYRERMEHLSTTKDKKNLAKIVFDEFGGEKKGQINQGIMIYMNSYHPELKLFLDKCEGILSKNQKNK